MSAGGGCYLAPFHIPLDRDLIQWAVAAGENWPMGHGAAGARIGRVCS